MTSLLPEVIWSLASAILSGGAAFALNHWMSRHSVKRRTVFATMIGLAPTAIAIGWVALPTNGQVFMSMSPEEFLIPLAIQIAIILIVSTPTAWLVSQRRRHGENLSNVFD